MRNRFAKGQRNGGCFPCNICGRNTREAGQAMHGLCPQCDEWTQIENGLADDLYETAEEIAAAEARVDELQAEAVKRGGTLAGRTMTP